MALKDKKTKITFHNGILTIGGTIIEVVYEDSHIFFDFGSEYNPKAPVQPENLQELLDENLVPYLDNMFDPSIPLKGYESKENKFKNTAVFLSHMHLDHSKIVNYLNPEVPLYTLEGTKSLLNTLNINNDFLFPLYENKGKNTRDITGVKENEVVEIGKIKVKVMPVDHDAYGACGLLIETPDLVISYTGDIRLHGYRKDATLNFCKESENCDVLLIEGVSVSFQDFDEVREDEISNEPELIEKINEIVKENLLEKLDISDFDAMFEIMEKSFPADERRPKEEQKDLFENPLYKVYCVGKMKAFMAVWEFDAFVFLEHFAVSPECRNEGLGSRMLAALAEMYDKKICLEVEPPETDVAASRIHFYERNGFFLNTYPYIQPPISKGKQPVPLMIMTSEAINEQEFEEIKSTLYKEVYKINGSF